MFRRRRHFESIRKRVRDVADALSHAFEDGESDLAEAPPESWRDFMRAGRHLADQGQYARAARMFRRASVRRPDHASTLQSLAAALLRAGEPDKALRRFEDILALDPAYAAAEHGRGLALDALSAPEAALDAFRRATSLDRHAWRSWQSIADLTPNEAERQLAVGRAADALVRAAANAESDPELIFACATELIHDGRPDDAVRFVERNVDRFKDHSTAHSKLASAHYHGGGFEAAFFHQERALQAIAPENIPPAPRPSSFKPDLAVEALQDVLTVLDAAGAKPFLCAGTLLGFIRNGGPLPHDRDVDIGVLSVPGATPDIAAVIREHPGLMLKRGARPKDRYFGLLHKDVGIDIFLYEASGDHVRCGFSHWPGDIQWRFTRFDLRAAEFGRLRCFIPSDPDRYLSESYGPDWRKPDKGFASAISSPALFETDPHARAFYSAARAKAALLAGDIDKALALLAQSPVPIDTSALERAVASRTSREAIQPSASNSSVS